MGLVKAPQFNFSAIPESSFGLFFGALNHPKTDLGLKRPEMKTSYTTNEN